MNNHSKTIKNNLPGPISLLKQAWKIYRKHFKTLILISLLGSIASIKPAIESFLGVSLSKSSSILIIVAIIVPIVLWLWSEVSTLYAIKDENNDVKDALLKGLKKLRSYIWVFFLSMLLIMGGYLLLIIPGILFSVWFSLAIFVLVSENIGGMSALLKSREYIRGYFWAVAGRSLFSIVFVSIIPLLFVQLLSLIHLPSYINTILSAIYSVISVPLFLIYSFLLYKNLKSIKGDFVFQPSSKRKAVFIVSGILGIVLIIILPILFVFYIISNNPKLKTGDLSSLSNMVFQTEMKKYYDKNGKYPENLKDLSLSSIPFKNYTYTLENGDFKLCYPEKSQMVCVRADSVSYSPIQ